MSVVTDRYREIAKDYLITKDMVLTYGKYHSKIKDRNVLEASASRLLSNANFLRVKEEVCREIEPNVEIKAKQCLDVLYNLSFSAQKSNDRITAASSYLKFTIGDKSTNTNINIEAQRKLVRDGLQELLNTS